MFRILIIFLAFSASAVLAKAPTVLNLWSEDNSAGLHFNCSPIFDGSGVIDDNKIECKSKSTRYNHKANSADFDKLWQSSEIPALFGKDGVLLSKHKDEISQTCDANTLIAFKSILGLKLDKNQPSLGTAELEKIKARLNKKNGAEREDFIKMARHLVNLCAKPSMKAFKELQRFSHDKEARTCSLAQQNLTEIYEKITDSVWVSQTKPDTSSCKRIQISTLRLPKGGNYNSDWEFEFKPISLDKLAKGIFGTSCGVADEESIELYTYRYKPVFVGCDYIEFFY